MHYDICSVDGTIMRKAELESTFCLFVCLFMYTASVMFDYYCRDSELSYIERDLVPVYTSFGGSWGL